MMDLATLVPWATAGFGTGAGFLMVRWFVEWLSSRADINRASLDSGMMTLIEALQHRVEDQDTRLARIESENEALRERVDRQRGRERGLEEENEDLRKEAIAMRETIALLETRLSALENMFKTLPLSPEMQEAIDNLDKIAPARRKRRAASK